MINAVLEKRKQLINLLLFKATVLVIGVPDTANRYYFIVKNYL